jgi:hypothetical protein
MFGKGWVNETLILPSSASQAKARPAPDAGVTSGFADKNMREQENSSPAGP